MVIDNLHPLDLAQTVLNERAFEQQDHLFALKLAVFELDKVKDSDKEDLKKKLRQSKNKIDVLSAVCEILS